MGRLKQQKLEQIIVLVRPYLVALAKDGRTVTYSILQSDLHLPRQDTGEILGEVSNREHKDGRPRLSALVVRKDTGLPGVGFFGLDGVPPQIRWPQEKEVSAEVTEKRASFALEERKRVFDYWQKPPAVS